MATALTSLANVKDWLGITDSASDTTLSRMVTSYSNSVANYINRDLGLQAYTENRDGKGGDTMVVTAFPLVTVTLVSVDDVVQLAQVGHGNPGYVFTDFRIILVGSVFTPGRQNVVLSYTAGFAAIPPDIEQATIEWISDRFKSRDRIGVNSRSLAGETVAYNLTDIPDAVAKVLAPYRKVIPQ